MEYKKYGDEWEREVMKNTKEVIVAMLRKVAQERDELYATQRSVHQTWLDSSEEECGCLMCAIRRGDFVVPSPRREVEEVEQSGQADGATAPKHWWSWLRWWWAQ